MAPYDLWTLLGSVGGFFAFLLIGVCFGFILESAGFGDSRRLAGQFYFKDLAVVRVMFTTILTSMLLVFAASSLGWMDYQDVWVNPTYLVPGVVGGLVMGVGFVVGGYCPGTSLAAAGSGKIDGIWFVAGALVGMGIFGELADEMAEFMQVTAWGRVTLDQTFGVPVWVAMVGVLAFGIFLFVLMDSLKNTIWSDSDHGAFKVGGLRVHPAMLLVPAALLLAPVVLFGMPDPDEVYALRHTEYDALLSERAAQIQPAELLGYMYNDDVVLQLVDVRDESSYNRFHLRDAVLADVDHLDAIWTEEPVANRLTVLISNDEAQATTAWRRLKAMKVPNLYLLEGGVNNWLATFGEASVVREVPLNERLPGELQYEFAGALGGRHHASRPSHHALEHFLKDHELDKRVKMVSKARKGGGCG